MSYTGGDRNSYNLCLRHSSKLSFIKCVTNSQSKAVIVYPWSTEATEYLRESSPKQTSSCPKQLIVSQANQ